MVLGSVHVRAGTRDATIDPDRRRGASQHSVNEAPLLPRIGNHIDAAQLAGGGHTSTGPTLGRMANHWTGESSH